MKKLFALVLFVCVAAVSSGAAFAKTQELFPNAVKVRAYLYKGTGKGEDGVLIGVKTLDATAVPKDGIELSADQVARLKLVFTKATGDQQLDYCFKPQHGFVFEDAEGKIVGTLDVSFACHRITTDAPGYREAASQATDLEEFRHLAAKFAMPPRDPPTDWEALAAIVTELGLPVEASDADYAKFGASASP